MSLSSGETPPEYGFTFGPSELETDWTDRRQISWDRLAELLTSHKFGPKEGPCVVPAVFSGQSRKKDEAVQIDVAFLDSDTGVPLPEIVSAVKRRGWAAIISSSHSHLTRRTTAKQSNWDRFFAKFPGSMPEDFLRQEKGYRPEVARGATTAETIDGLVQIDHLPCPKFRVVIPLAKPWRASDYPSQAVANAAWKEAVEALAGSLSLPHDQSCTDTSRLFYLPRKPRRGAVPETEILEGKPCDIFALVVPKESDLLNGHPRKLNGHHRPSSDRFDYVDPITGEFIDLRDWAKSHGRGFMIAKMLRDKRPQALTGLIVNEKVHIRCPNDGSHTDSKQDGATFVCNAGHANTKGFVIHCRHAHCTDKDRLFFVHKMLEERWIEIDDLTRDEFQLPVDASEAPAYDENDPGPDPGEQPGEPDLEWEWGLINARGLKWAVPLDIFQAEAEKPPQATSDHIPARLWPFVLDTSVRMGVDPTTVGLGAIVTCAAVVHDDWRIQPKRHDRTWTESARLWGCIVGDPSVLKSPVVMACTRIIDRMEAESRRRHDAEMENYERAHAAWKKLKDTDEPEPKRPKLDRYLVEGTTMEAFQEVLRDDPKAHQRAVAGKVLCRQDEMSEWAGNLDRYGGGKGGGDRGGYLRLYNGGRFTVDRISRGSFAVSNWSACFLTGCQPEPIQKIARDAAEDGLLQRFIYAVPGPTTEGFDQAEDETAIENYHAIIRALAVMRPLQKEGGYGVESVVFHEGAHQHREEIDKAARAIAMIPDTSNRVKSTLGKWPGLFARLCLTFHMIESAGKEGFRYVIPEAVAEQVKLYLLEIVLPHLIRADATMFLTPQTGHARWIAGHILAHGKKTITTREVVHAYRPLRSPEQSRELTTTMASLVAVGWLDPQAPKNPLAPVNSWAVNPQVHTRFADRAAQEAASREAVRAMIRNGTESYMSVGFASDETVH